MNYRTIILFAACAATLTSCGASADGSSSGDSNIEPGQGGSMSRFAIVGSNLYTLNSPVVKQYDISSAEEIRYINEGMIEINDGETIFVRDSLLYVGSQSGMYIMNLKSLALLSSTSHFVSCDPVVALDTFAYVTLSTGSSCSRGISALQLYNVKNPFKPKFVKGYSMVNPRGLAIRDSLLFVCDDGLKIFYAKHPVDSLPRLAHVKNIDGYDIIARDTTLLLIGSDGFFQYRYDITNADGKTRIALDLLSSILATKQEK